jgi:lipopolysaccharide/colanic/teichoic acid biosynthesis glycosyltransferase
MWKIRTMTDDVEADTGPVWATNEDPRAGAFGRFLRRHHLDELPQLLNVARGEMGLVGPRPERPAFTNVLSSHLRNYALRHNIRPGITGLAQVLVSNHDEHFQKSKLDADLEYVKSASLRVDVSILLRTVVALLGF